MHSLKYHILGRFILTMRNVNYLEHNSPNGKPTCFILTMRNVNLLFKTHSKYVPSCFILTMENATYIKSIFKLKIILLNL